MLTAYQVSDTILSVLFVLILLFPLNKTESSDDYYPPFTDEGNGTQNNLPRVMQLVNGRAGV